jgi:hypothetical protein
VALLEAFMALIADIAYFSFLDNKKAGRYRLARQVLSSL